MVCTKNKNGTTKTKRRLKSSQEKKMGYKSNYTWNRIYE